MAGIFSPTLQSEVSPIQATEQPSAAASILGVLGEGVRGLADARDRAARQAAAAAPSYSERKDQFDAQQLGSYTQELDDIHQSFASGGISEAYYNTQLRTLNNKYLTRGVGIDGPDFDAARENITGQPNSMFGFSEDELAYNNLSATPEGQGQLAYAAISLREKGVEDFNQADLISEVNLRSSRKLAVDDIQITDELSWRKALPVYLDQAVMFEEDTMAAVNALTGSGQFITGEMLQTRYLESGDIKRQLEARIPSNISTDDRAQFDRAWARIDDTFKALGMTSIDGKISIKSQDELKLQDKAKLAVTMLNESSNGADHILAAGIIQADYVMTPEQSIMLTSRFTELGNTSISSSDIPTSDITISNNLMTSYNTLIEAQVNNNMGSLGKADVGALSLVNPEEQAKWAGLTNAEGWAAAKAFGTASKGFSVQAIQSGNMTDGFFNTMAGLALSFESIDILEEPISFNGVKAEVSANLPNLVKTAKAVDAAKGEAIEALLYRSFGIQKAQYDTRVKSDEASMGIVLNTDTGLYNVSSNTSDTKVLGLFSFVNRAYGGDLSKAYQDNFNSVEWSDLGPEDQISAVRQSGMSKEEFARSLWQGMLPNEDDFKMVLDMRKSSTYLSNLASQLEPSSVTQQREDMVSAQADVAALAPTSVSASLIDRFEAGSGGYDTLFGQAQRAGKQFEGTRVSEKTLGELYQFSDTSGAYGAYVKGANPKGVLATPMGRYQFVGTTLKDVAKKMGLPDDTVFNKETQDSMFLFLARDVISGKRQAQKRDALRRTWDGFRNATDTELNQMIAEIEGGNPDLGGTVGSDRTPATVPEVTTTPLEATATASAAPASGGASVNATMDTVSVDTTATLPEQQQSAAQAAPTEGRQAASGPSTPPEITALIQALGGRKLTEEEVSQLDQYISSLGG